VGASAVDAATFEMSAEGDGSAQTLRPIAISSQPLQAEGFALARKLRAGPDTPSDAYSASMQQMAPERSICQWSPLPRHSTVSAEAATIARAKTAASARAVAGRTRLVRIATFFGRPSARIE